MKKITAIQAGEEIKNDIIKKLVKENKELEEIIEKNSLKKFVKADEYISSIKITNDVNKDLKAKNKKLQEECEYRDFKISQWRADDIKAKKANKTLKELVDNQRNRIGELEKDTEDALLHVAVDNTRAEKLHKMYSEALKEKDNKYWKEYKKRWYYEKKNGKIKQLKEYFEAHIAFCDEGAEADSVVYKKNLGTLQKKYNRCFYIALTIGVIALIQFLI